MRRILVYALSLIMLLVLSPACYADIDLSSMSRDELIRLREQVDHMLWNDEDKEQYISAACELTNSMYLSALDIGNVLNLELNFAQSLKKIGGTYSPEKGRESGLRNFEKKSGKTWDDIVASREEVLDLYHGFIEIDPSADLVCTEIRDSVKTLFESYNEMYYTSITPSISALNAVSTQLSAFSGTYNTLMDSYLR